MPRNRFADALGVDRLELSDGDWIDVRRELSVGDEQMVIRLGFDVKVFATGKTEMTPRVEMVQVARLVVGIVGWSLIDEEGPVRLSPDPEARAKQFLELKPEDLAEIREVYERYRAQQEEKKHLALMTTTEPS